MLAKRKGTSKSKVASLIAASGPLRLRISRLLMADYSADHYDKERLRELAAPLCNVDAADTAADLEQVRGLIESETESKNWCFVDSVTAIRFFRIDRAQENLHYALDICDDDGLLYILMDEEGENIEAAAAAADDDIEEESLQQDASSSSQDEPPLPPLIPAASPKNVPSSQASQGRRPKTVEEESQDDIFEADESSSSSGGGGNSSSNNNNSPENKDLNPKMQQQQLEEKTTEGILKAARLGDLVMLEELFCAGYSLLSVDETGKTALHYASRFGHKEIVRFLIAKAPKSLLDMADMEKGQTALHKASGYKRRTICCMLVAAGASLLVRDDADLTPRLLAVMADDNELASYLESQEKVQREQARGRISISEGDFETPV